MMRRCATYSRHENENRTVALSRQRKRLSLNLSRGQLAPRYRFRNGKELVE
jgi:hypothetical protein